MERRVKQEDIRLFEDCRPRLSAFAYRMLGSVADAEDAVQDTWLRWQKVERASVREPVAFLISIVNRICLDRMKSARARRELYVGPWLPEPLIEAAGTEPAPDPATTGDVTVALMLTLERLSPLERAAFILRQVFEVDYAELAEILSRTEPACRQLVSRARARIREEKPRFQPDPGVTAEIASAFLTAAREGDMTRLRSLLAENAAFHSDGGGRRAAALNVISGGSKIARFFAGVSTKGAAFPRWRRQVVVNGLPGELSVEHDGTVQTMALQIEDDRVAAVYMTRNPDKLGSAAVFLPVAHRASVGRIRRGG